MVVLIDTNIIVDFLTEREPFARDAVQVINLCYQKKVKGYLAAHTVSNLFYILRKDFSVPQRKEILSSLCRIFEISGIDKEKIITALSNNSFSDFEDCLQMECAAEVSADYIITRNISDFIHSTISVLEPKDFLKIFS